MVVKGDGRATSGGGGGTNMSQFYRRKENERNKQRMSKGGRYAGKLTYGHYDVATSAPAKTSDRERDKGKGQEAGNEEARRSHQGGSLYSKLASFRHKLGSKLSVMSKPAECAFPDCALEERPDKVAATEPVWEDTATPSCFQCSKPILKNVHGGDCSAVASGKGTQAEGSAKGRKSVTFEEFDETFERFAPKFRQMVADGKEAKAKQKHHQAVAVSQEHTDKAKDRPASCLKVVESRSDVGNRDLARRLANKSSRSFFSTAKVISVEDNDGSKDSSYSLEDFDDSRFGIE